LVFLHTLHQHSDSSM